MTKTYFVKAVFSMAFMLLFCTIKVAAQTTHNITDPEDLTSLSLSAGDTVILADGTYSSDERISFLGTGTVDMPITFRPETPGGVIFTGGLKMSIAGTYLVVEGFHWVGGIGASNFIEFRKSSEYANNCTIQNCVIDGLGFEQSEMDEAVAGGSILKHRWIVLHGNNNNVLNCSFLNKRTAGALILVELAYNAVHEYEDPITGQDVEELSPNRCNPVQHTIANNYVFNFEKMAGADGIYGQKLASDGVTYTDLSNAGDSETIRIGESNYKMLDANCIITNNYFVQADGENEIITNKSTGNTYTDNTFRRCRGSLVLRHGPKATVSKNHFLGENVEGTGGIRIVDSEHNITDNYIQDCINVVSQAKWNNGITFLGGNDTTGLICSDVNSENGYQKSQNNTIANNTIVNTNAPVFFNDDKGGNSNTGTVFSNNLIYFNGDAGSGILTDVITDDNGDLSAYNDIAAGISFTGNVFSGTNLGPVNNGFTSTAITGTKSDEIYTFTGADGKGANLSGSTIKTDDMVGFEVGACFVDYTGANISNPICNTIAPPPPVDYISLSALPTVTAAAGSHDVSVSANVSWTAMSNDAWITIDTNSASGDATVSVTVTENTATTDRTGSVTFTQDAGGDNVVRTLNVTQSGADLTDMYTLINSGTNGAPVTVHSFSKDNTAGGKTEVAANTLDKADGTVWAADDDAVPGGASKADGEYIIYDLGSTHNLKLIQFSTTNKSDAFGFQIYVSTTGTDAADFSMVLPTSGDLLLTATGTTDFNQYEIDHNARYVKVVGFGRFDPTGTTRKSAWSAIDDIEFYGPKSLSVDDKTLNNSLVIYPVPTKNTLNIKSTTSAHIKSISIYNTHGQKLIDKNVDNLSNTEINTASLSNGMYLIRVNTEKGSLSKAFIVSK
ncbi:chondroitinase-B domain-containing protein [Tamlana sp. I1]|uniref:chondroitinase-B domain-containing protein n=1 Tax=Tamlana sp. I1 TaxID=2762061 RepID=UPI00188E92B3|nr:chondroitinase-B domain-containing protein [Tamlana sp. I1]